MPETSEVSVPKETVDYSPQETHRSWLEKAISVKDTVAFYAASVSQAVLSTALASKAFDTRGQIEVVQDLAKQVGGVLSPESLHYLTRTTNLSETGAIVAGIGSLSFFGAGTLRIIRSEGKEK